MAKAVQKARGKFLDEKYLGPEPDLSEGDPRLKIALAYNWYNYFYNSEDGKNFTLTYLRQKKFDKDKLKILNSVSNWHFNTIGWNCRILFNGGKLPEEIETSMWERLENLCATNVAVEEVVEEPKNVVSIQDRIANKASELVGDIEVELDKFYINNKDVFEVKKWFQGRGIKPQVAARIAEYYKPLYAEVFDAIQGKDEQLKEAYARWKKPALKVYLEILKDIIAQADFQTEIAKATRKPRKKKEQPVTKIVEKLNYLSTFPEMSLTSIKPTEIVKSTQLWVYNVKTKTVSVYNAMGPAGLSVKGSTLIGFDEKTSITKKLRKPSEQVKQLLEAGKINLRKYMENVKTVPKEANGRINKDTILVKVIK
jgi:hypothetical protein